MVGISRVFRGEEIKENNSKSTTKSKIEKNPNNFIYSTITKIASFTAIDQ